MCWICGVVIGAKLFSNPVWGGLPIYEDGQIREEALKWCSLYRASESFLALIESVEQFPVTVPEETDQRSIDLVIFQCPKRDSPFLSGVGCFTNAHRTYTLVPHDQEAKYDDRPPPETIGIVPVDAEGQQETNADVYAYLIHTYCWDFLKDSVGDIIYSQLVQLVYVLRCRWVDEDYGGAKPFLDVVWEGGRNESQSTLEFVTDPVNVPEVLRLKENYALDVSHGVTVTQYNESQYWLPLELKLMVLDYLKYRDVQSTLSALGWKVPAHYWRKRFRSSLFFEMKDISLREDDWLPLWFASEDLLHNQPPPGLSNRLRIFNILRGVILDLDSYGRLYEAGQPSIDLDLWSIVYKSAMIDELANAAIAVSIPSTVRKLNFSFVQASSSGGFLLSGIKFLPEGSTLGYCLPDESLPERAIFSVPTTLNGIMVKLDAKGVRDIMPLCKDSLPRWIMGFSNEDSAVGVLFDDANVAGIKICAMVDVRLMECSQA